MDYPKPLSQKSLDKMYAAAKIGPVELDFLRTFFAACANLYGRIPLSHAWVVYKELGKKTDVPKIQLKNILSFSSIARREEHSYYIFEVDELYCKEPRITKNREIVLNKLIRIGYGKLSGYYSLMEAQADKPYYVPQDLLSFAMPKVSREEKAVLNFLGNLKVTEKEHVNEYGLKLPTGKLGQRLNSFVFLNYMERFEVDYLQGKISDGPKANPKALKKYMENLQCNESVKIVNQFKEASNRGYMDVTGTIKDVFTELNEVGAGLCMKDAQKLTNLLMEMQNNSHLLCNRGWTPNGLHQQMGGGMPTSISFGPGIQKGIAEGKIDKDELVKMYESMGLKVVK